MVEKEMKNQTEFESSHGLLYYYQRICAREREDKNACKESETLPNLVWLFNSLNKLGLSPWVFPFKNRSTEAKYD